MDKGLIVYLLVFLLLIGAGLAFANTDQITPTVAEAQVGSGTMAVVSEGLSLLGKLLLGGAAAGVAGAVFTEARKAYKTWQRNSRAKRWISGPNARWQGQQTQTPKLRREDLMLLALAGRNPPEAGRNSQRRGPMRVSDDEKDVELEMPL